MSKAKILVLAQIPPPYHGQSIMQKYLVDVDWEWCNKDFEQMRFSNDIPSIGIFKTNKIIELIRLIRKVNKKSTPKFDLIYYPPGGPNRTPIYRDLVLIYFLRKKSKKILFHFHAGGINQIFEKVTKIEATLIKKVFKNPDGAIVLSDYLKKEIEWCNPMHIYTIANGIKDSYLPYQEIAKPIFETTIILFVGNLKKEKGIFVLLEASYLLKQKNQHFLIKFMGDFHNDAEKNIFLRYIKDKHLEENIELLGIMDGEQKWQQFHTANIFCLPTIATEAMPVSIIEAMMFSLPVVSTNWRSIPDVVLQEKTGLLCEPNNASQLAENIHSLICDFEMRNEYGKNGRKSFLEKYTVDIHLKKMENAFKDVLKE